MDILISIGLVCNCNLPTILEYIFSPKKLIEGVVMDSLTTNFKLF